MTSYYAIYFTIKRKRLAETKREWLKAVESSLGEERVVENERKRRVLYGSNITIKCHGG